VAPHMISDATNIRLHDSSHLPDVPGGRLG
jgi:hypothetical protein